MQIVALHPTWHNLIDPRWIQSLDETPFLSRCRSGVVTRAELHGFVRQQYYYSRHFTRYLCALLANITDDSDRLELTKNLFEEMGLGAFGSLPHSRIYRNMMAVMGVVAPEGGENAGTSRLTHTMLECCRHSNPMVGLAALGLGAEAIVPHLYSQVIMGFQSIGQAPADLEFFRIHVEGDDDHAVTMRNVLDREIERDPGQRSVVRETAQRVIAARKRFLDDVAVRVNGSLDSHGGRRALVQL
jgi:pyrroloquinoline-quinone synthase